MGYIIDGVLTRELNAEGWMTVRDVGYEDEEGFIYIVGREEYDFIWRNQYLSRRNRKCIT